MSRIPPTTALLQVCAVIVSNAFLELSQGRPRNNNVEGVLTSYRLNLPKLNAFNPELCSYFASKKAFTTKEDAATGATLARDGDEFNEEANYDAAKVGLESFERAFKTVFGEPKKPSPTECMTTLGELDLNTNKQLLIINR